MNDETANEVAGMNDISNVGDDRIAEPISPQNYNFDSMSDDELEKRVSELRSQVNPEKQVVNSNPRSFDDMSDEELEETVKRLRSEVSVSSQNRLNDRLSLSDELEKKASFIADETDGDENYKEDHDFAVRARDALSTHKTNFAKLSDEQVDALRSGIERRYDEASKRRGHLDVAWDALKRGHSSIMNMMVQGYEALKPGEMSQEDADIIRGAQKNANEADILAPKKVGGIENISSAGDAIDYLFETIGENAERMAIGAAGATIGAIAAPAIGIGAGVGAMVLGGASTLLGNTGEAVSDQLEENRDDGDIRKSRAYAIAQGIGYSILDGAFGVSKFAGKIWGSLLRRAGLKGAAKGASVEAIKDMAEKATLKGIAKEIGKEAILGEGLQEMAQSQGVGRGVRYFQTGSIFRKKEDGTYETPGDAFLEAANEFVGGATAGLTFGLLGGASAHVDARRASRISHETDAILKEDKTYQELPEYSKLLVDRHLQNDRFLATENLITEDVKDSLEKSNNEIDAEIDYLSKNGTDEEKVAAQSAKAYLDIFKSQYSLEGLDEIFGVDEKTGEYVSRDGGKYTSNVDPAEMLNNGEERIDDKTGKGVIIYRNPTPGSEISVGEMLDENGKPTGKYMVQNAQQYKTPVGGDGDYIFDSRDKAFEAARRLDAYNQWREDRLQSKAALANQVFTKLFGNRGVNLEFVDRPTEHKYINPFTSAAFVPNPKDENGQPKGPTLFLDLGQIENLGALYTTLVHERSHEDIVEFLMKNKDFYRKVGNKVVPDWNAIEAARLELMAKVQDENGQTAEEVSKKFRDKNGKLTHDWGRSAGVAGEEMVAERNSVYELARQLRDMERGAIGSVVDKIRQAIGLRMAVEMGVDPSAIMPKDVSNELKKIFDLGYIGEPAAAEFKRETPTWNGQPVDAKTTKREQLRRTVGPQVAQTANGEGEVTLGTESDEETPAAKPKTLKPQMKTGGGNAYANNANIRRADGATFTKVGTSDGSYAWKNLDTNELVGDEQASEGGYEDIYNEKPSETSEKAPQSAPSEEGATTPAAEAKPAEAKETASKANKPAKVSKINKKTAQVDKETSEKAVSEPTKAEDDGETAQNAQTEKPKSVPNAKEPEVSVKKPVAKPAPKAEDAKTKQGRREEAKKEKVVSKTETTTPTAEEKSAVATASQSVEKAPESAPKEMATTSRPEAAKPAETKEERPAAKVENEPVRVNTNEDTLTIEQGKSGGEAQSVNRNDEVTLGTESDTEETRRINKAIDETVDNFATFVNDAQRKTIKGLSRERGEPENFKKAKKDGYILVTFNGDEDIIGPDGNLLTDDEIDELYSENDAPNMVRHKTMIPTLINKISRMNDAGIVNLLSKGAEKEISKANQLSNDMLLKRAMQENDYSAFLVLWKRWTAPTKENPRGFIRSWFEKKLSERGRSYSEKEMSDLIAATRRSFVRARSESNMLEVDREIADGIFKAIVEAETEEKTKDGKDNDNRDALEYVDSAIMDKIRYYTGMFVPVHSGVGLHPNPFVNRVFSRARKIAKAEKKRIRALFEQKKYRDAVKEYKSTYLTYPSRGGTPGLVSELLNSPSEFPDLEEIHRMFEKDFNAESKSYNRNRGGTPLGDKIGAEALLYGLLNNVWSVKSMEGNGVDERKARFGAERSAQIKKIIEEEKAARKRRDRADKLYAREHGVSIEEARRIRMRLRSDEVKVAKEFEGFVTAKSGDKMTDEEFAKEKEVLGRCVSRDGKPGDEDARHAVLVKASEMVSRLAGPSLGKYGMNNPSNVADVNGYILDLIEKQWRKGPSSRSAFWSGKSESKGNNLEANVKASINNRVMQLRDKSLKFDSLDEALPGNEYGSDDGSRAATREEQTPTTDTEEGRDNEERREEEKYRRERGWFASAEDAVDAIINSGALPKLQSDVLLALVNTWKSRIVEAEDELRSAENAGESPRRITNLKKALKEARKLGVTDTVISDAATAMNMNEAVYRGNLFGIFDDIEKAMAGKTVHMMRKSGANMPNGFWKRSIRLSKGMFSEEDVTDALSGLYDSIESALNYSVDNLIFAMKANGDAMMAKVVEMARDGKTNKEIFNAFDKGEFDNLKNSYSIDAETANQSLEEAYRRYGWIDVRVFGQKNDRGDRVRMFQNVLRAFAGNRLFDSRQRNEYKKVQDVLGAWFDMFGIDINKEYGAVSSRDLAKDDAEKVYEALEDNDYDMSAARYDIKKDNPVRYEAMMKNYEARNRLAEDILKAIDRNIREDEKPIRNRERRQTVKSDHAVVSQMMADNNNDENAVRRLLKESGNDDKRVESMFTHWRSEANKIAEREKKAAEREAKKEAGILKGLSDKMKSDVDSALGDSDGDISVALDILEEKGWDENQIKRARNYYDYKKQNAAQTNEEVVSKMSFGQKSALVKAMLAQTGDAYMTDEEVLNEAVEKYKMPKAAVRMIIDNVRQNTEIATDADISRRTKKLEEESGKRIVTGPDALKYDSTSLAMDREAVAEARAAVAKAEKELADLGKGAPQDFDRVNDRINKIGMTEEEAKADLRREGLSDDRVEKVFKKYEDVKKARANVNEKKAALAKAEEKLANAVAKANGEPSGARNKTITQAISSAGTSLPQNDPTLYKSKWLADSLVRGNSNFDIGAGKTMKPTERLANAGVENVKFDPFNLSKAENEKAISRIVGGEKFPTVTCANVLNVIAEPESRENVILQAAKAVSADGKVFFDVYTAPREGVTKTGTYQTAMKPEQYVPEIEKFFGKVERHGSIIVASRPKADAVRGNQAEWWNVAPGAKGFSGVRYKTSGLYTGSAADYEKPSLLKVGTGEGSQVYGWGLYASNRRGVAESYAKRDVRDKRHGKLSGVPGMGLLSRSETVDSSEVYLDGKKVERTPDENPKTIVEDFLREHTPSEIDELIREMDDDEQAVRLRVEEQFIEKMYGPNWDELDVPTEEMSEDVDEVVDYFKSHVKDYKLVDISPKENVYEQTFFTNRAPGDESHLLSWYEPVSEENIKRIADQLDTEGVDWSKYLEYEGETTERFVRKESKPLPGFRGGVNMLYDRLSKLLGSPKAASEFLARADIDGIKYPVDSYGSKTVKDGDKAGWNYVSFRDDNITVDHKWVDGMQRYKTMPGANKYTGLSDPNAGFAAEESLEARGFGKRVKRPRKVRAVLDRQARDLIAKDPLMLETVSKIRNGGTPSDVEIAALNLRLRQMQYDAVNGNLDADLFQKNEENMTTLVEAIRAGKSEAGAALQATQVGVDMRTLDMDVYMLAETKAKFEKQIEKESGVGTIGEHEAELRKALEEKKGRIKEMSSEMQTLHDELDKANERLAKVHEKAEDETIERAYRRGVKQGEKQATEAEKKRRLDAVNNAVGKFGAIKERAGIGVDSADVIFDIFGAETRFAGNPKSGLTDAMRNAFAGVLYMFDGDADKARNYLSAKSKDAEVFKSKIEPMFNAYLAEEEKAAKPKDGTVKEKKRIVKERIRKRAESSAPKKESAKTYRDRLVNKARNAYAQTLMTDSEEDAMPHIGEFARNWFKVLAYENPDQSLDNAISSLVDKMNELYGEFSKGEEKARFDTQDARDALLGKGEFAPVTKEKAKVELARILKAIRLLSEGKEKEALKEAGMRGMTDADILQELDRRIGTLLNSKLNSLEDRIEAKDEDTAGLRKEIHDLIMALHDIRSGKPVGELLNKYLNLAVGMKDYRKQRTLLDQLESRKAMYEKKLKDNDFEPAPKVSVPDDKDELLKVADAQRHLEKARERFKRERSMWKVRKGPAVSRFAGSILELLGEVKAVAGSMDLSAVLRQGGQMTFAHPIMAYKSFKKTLEAFRSEKVANEIMDEIAHRPNYQYYIEAGIDFTDWGDNAASAEDMYVLNKYRLITRNKLMKWGINASERAFVTYLNLMRANVFDAMVACSPMREAEKLSKEQLLAIGRFVNIASQRGAIDQSGKLGKALELANGVLWSPRNIISRFQFIWNTFKLAVPGVKYYGISGDMEMRKAFAKETARYVAGVAIAIFFAKMMADLLRDDDEPPVDIVTDPKSSDFLKVKVGNTRLDFLSGLQQVMVFGSRMWAGEKTQGNGNTVKKDRGEMLARFARTKFSPAAGIIYDLFTREDFDRRDISFNPLNLTKDKDTIGVSRYLAGSLFMPLIAGDVIEQAEDSIGRLPATFILSALGAGVQTYDSGTYKVMKQDYQYFKRLWKAADSDEERKRLELYHPMLKRMDSLDQWIPSVNALERNLKKLEAANARPSDLKTIKDEIERRKKIVLNLMTGQKNPTDVQ